MRRMTAGLLALLLASSLAACGDDGDDESAAAPAAETATAEATGQAPDGDKPPIRVALIGAKIPGLNMLDAFEAGADVAARKLNAEGGVGGREVIVDTCNSMLQPATAVTCARKTVADEPVAQFGCEVSWSATGLPIYAKAGIPSFNCLNTPEDFSNPMSFGLAASAFGEARGAAKYLCGQADVKKIAVVAQDLPQQRRDTPKAVQPIIDGCGKQVEYFYLPYGSADLTPHFNKVKQAKPDFVVNQSGSLQTLQMFKAFKQLGYPADKTISADGSFGYDTVLEPSGDAVDGAMSTFQFVSWGDTGNPDVVEYLKEMEGSKIDARDALPQWGYSMVMWIAAVAEELGTDAFDGQALAEFARTKDGTPIPLSRTLENPGPKDFPQQKQPYVQLVQWQDGKLHVVDEGTDDGWVSGY